MEIKSDLFQHDNASTYSIWNDIFYNSYRLET